MTVRQFGGLDALDDELRPSDRLPGRAWSWVAEDRPSIRWELRQVVSTGGTTDHAVVPNPLALLEALPSDLTDVLLPWRPTPTRVDAANAYGLRTAFDHVARQLPATDLLSRVRGLPPDATERLALLLAAPSADLILEVVASLEALPDAEADFFAYAVGSDAGTTRTHSARILTALEDVAAVDPHPLRSQADSIRTLADAHGGRVGGLLRAIAAHARGADDDPDVLDLVKRCKEHGRERDHAASS